MPIEMTCVSCNQPFYCYPNEAEKGRKYCSLTCRSVHLHKKGLSAASRMPVPFTCKECGKPFTMMQSYLTAYRKKFDKQPSYCSMTCSNTGRRKDSELKNTFSCLHCGKEQSRRRKPGGRIYAQQKFCDQTCKIAYQSTQALNRFNRGEYKTHVKRNGYVWITIPILGRTGRKHIMEHRYVMSKHLGRDLLPEETVHHVNGIRSQNNVENLELFSSRHGPGQRVIDKVQFAIGILILYPGFARQAGYELHPVPH